MTTSRGVRRRGPQGSYVITLHTPGSPEHGGTLRLPGHIVKAVPEGMMFSPRLVEEGILYEPVQIDSGNDLPSWARTGDTA